MASNMANFYAELSRKYSDSFMVTYAPAPSYLKSIVDPEETRSKVILCYIEDRVIASVLSFLSPEKNKSKANKRENSDLDLTGSPLKDDCEVDVIEDISLELLNTNPWTHFEECHKGLSVERARSVLCSEAFKTAAAAVDAQGSVWFVCTGTDPDQTLLLQYECAPKHFSRGSVNFLGVAPAYSVNSQSLLRLHFGLIRPGTRVDTTIENTYAIKANMALKCSWSTASQVPSLVDLSSCDVVLAQTFRLGECGTMTQDLINQLRILMVIRDDIVTYKRGEEADVGKEAVYRCGRGIDMEELREGINKVMTEISGFVESHIGGGLDRDLEAVVQRAKLRRLTDLTDNLWELLKCCSSYKDLKMAFNILFQCAARCNIVNTPTNKNRLAEIITEVANRRLAIPCLTGSEPLELLLEIGIEKLHKDYEYIFTESKICSANILNTKHANEAPNALQSQENGTARKTLLHNHVKGSSGKFPDIDVLGFKNSHFEERPTAIRLAKLLQIHCTLEHLLMIHINLSLGNIYSDIVEQLLKRPLRFLQSIDESLTDEMEISLSAHSVREQLEGREPRSRRIIMKSKNKFREVKSTFFYCMENIFPPSISESFLTEEKEMGKENTYFCWVHHKIGTVK